jgi:hypothetical protein
VTALELHVDLLPGVGDLVLEADERVVCADHPENTETDGEDDNHDAHGGSEREA